MEKHTVFISHAHADNALCDAYAKELANLGLDVWYDQANMEYAQLISETIGHELKQRTALVIMLTPNAVKSAWVNLEIATFLAYWTKDHSKRLILPVMLADCESPPLLESFKRIDVSIMTQQEAIETIARTLGAEVRVNAERVMAHLDDAFGRTKHDDEPQLSSAGASYSKPAQPQDRETLCRQIPASLSTWLQRIWNQPKDPESLRRQILDDLRHGRITLDDAERRLSHLRKRSHLNGVAN